MKIAREGIPFLLLSILATLFFRRKNRFLSRIGLLLSGMMFWFFRDPERSIQLQDSGILSPADGTIVGIEDVEESEFIHGDAVKISIFMSLFDVHVNRAPVSGSVALVRHIPGEFLNAASQQASFENERTLVGLETSHGRLLFKQIAGLVARRIVCRLKEGELVEQGQRVGMIKFSSRVEVFIPRSNALKIKVQVMDKVQAGLTTLAEYHA